MDEVYKISEDGKTLLGVKDKYVKEVVIPNGVVAIGDEAFINCYDLQHVEIPDTVTSIGIRAFAECSSLDKIDIPDSVASIGKGAFILCI